jgi:hypothetical protein
MTTTDYIVMHFNGAHRTRDQETTDATAIHPLSSRCEIFLSQYEKSNNIQCVGGVFLLNGLGSNLIDKLNEQGFCEATFFSDNVLANA